MSSSTKRSAARQGIEERTDRSGTTRYRGPAYDDRARRKLRGPWTPHLAEARAWRVDAQARLQAGTLSAVTGPTIREAAQRFMAGIESGAIRTRKTGRRYKSSGIRAYKHGFRTRVLPALGATRMARLTRTDVQVWVDSLSATGLAPNTVRNAVTPLQALYGWARSRGLVHINPCTDLELPTGEEARDRIAAPAEAAALIAAVPAKDQAALGLAVYAGLRIGELLALSWEAIDLDARTLRVARAWDDTRLGSSQRPSPRPGRIASCPSWTGWRHCWPITRCSWTIPSRGCCSPALGTRPGHCPARAFAVDAPMRGERPG